MPFSEDSNIRRIQKIELDLVKTFTNICEQNNLRYYACGGTLLGAVRHHGFIPWDDDVDLAMPRNDYEKFNSICAGKNALPPNLGIMHSQITHIYDNDHAIEMPTYLLGDLDIKGKCGVLIDILPIDGMPMGKCSQKLHLCKVLFCNLMLRLANVNHVPVRGDRSKVDNLIIRIGHLVHTERMINPKKWSARVHKVMKHYPFDDSVPCGILIGRHRSREVMPPGVWGKGIKMQFEDIELTAPTKWDTYLSKCYGDYMELPPLSSRSSRHSIKLLEPDKV